MSNSPARVTRWSWRAATDEGRLPLTLDRGIGDLRRYPAGGHAGVLVLRPVAQDPNRIPDLIKRLVRTHPLDELRGCVVVVEPRKVRIRRADPDDPSWIPEDAHDQIRRWADRRLPEHARDQVRLEVDVTDRTVTILEMPPAVATRVRPGLNPVSRSLGCATRSLATDGRCTGETGTSSSTSTSLPTPRPTSRTSSTRSTATPPASSGAEPVSSGPQTFRCLPKSRLPRVGFSWREQ
jgi:hypothetical protein